MAKGKDPMDLETLDALCSALMYLDGDELKPEERERLERLASAAALHHGFGGWVEALHRNSPSALPPPKLHPATEAKLRGWRAWHWDELLKLRKKAAGHRKDAASDEHNDEYEERCAKVCDRRADGHMRAVQLLNDLVSGTAEQDVTRGVAPRRVGP